MDEGKGDEQRQRAIRGIPHPTHGLVIFIRIRPRHSATALDAAAAPGAEPVSDSRSAGWLAGWPTAFLGCFGWWLLFCCFRCCARTKQERKVALGGKRAEGQGKSQKLRCRLAAGRAGTGKKNRKENKHNNIIGEVKQMREEVDPAEVEYKI